MSSKLSDVPNRWRRTFIPAVTGPEPVYLHPGPQLVKTDLCFWIHLQVIPQCLTDVIRAKCTALVVLSDRTGTNSASCTTREQSSRCRPASVTIRYIAWRHGHAVVFGALPGDRDAQALSLCSVRFDCCQMDRAGLTVEAAI